MQMQTSSRLHISTLDMKGHLLVCKVEDTPFHNKASSRGKAKHETVGRVPGRRENVSIKRGPVRGSQQ